MSKICTRWYILSKLILQPLNSVQRKLHMPSITEWWNSSYSECYESRSKFPQNTPKNATTTPKMQQILLIFWILWISVQVPTKYSEKCKKCNKYSKKCNKYSKKCNKYFSYSEWYESRPKFLLNTPISLP